MSLARTRLIDIPSHEDERGVLSSIEELTTVPIEIRRIFYIHQVTQDRGGHANIDTDQILIPVSGSLKIRLYDKTSSMVYVLDDPKKGLFIPRMIFLEMFDFKEGTVCLVLANTPYDHTQYIRSKEEYFSLTGSESQP